MTSPRLLKPRRSFAAVALSAGASVRVLAVTTALAALVTGCATGFGDRSKTTRGTRGIVGDKGELELHESSSGLSAAQRERVAAAQRYVNPAAERFGLDPDLINGVIWVESRFQPTALSPVGAKGLMQLMPATASELARQLEWRRPNRSDPHFNVTAGSFYLSRLLRHYDGDLALALAAYNAGPGNVDKWRSQGKALPSYSQKYIKMVFEARDRFAALRRGPGSRDTGTMLAQQPRPPQQPAPPPVRLASPEPHKPTAPTTAARSQPKSPSSTGDRQRTPRPDPERARALAEAYRLSQERVRRARARLAAQGGSPSGIKSVRSAHPESTPREASSPAAREERERDSAPVVAKQEDASKRAGGGSGSEIVGVGVLPSVLE